MITTQGKNATAALAFDTQSLDQLKLQSKNDPAKAAAGAAKQFESMFLGMVLKSMREATPQDGMFDNEQTKLYTSLLDQQLAQHIAARGTGLSEVMARQLSANAVSPDAAHLNADAGIPLTDGSPSLHEVTSPDTPSALSPTTLDFANRTLLRAAEAARTTAPKNAMQVDTAPKPLPRAMPAPAPEPAAMPASASDSSSPLTKTRDFIQRVWQHALDAAQAVGIKPQFMVGQAALESGWGQHEIRNANGSSTHNLFGVKAGKDWAGPVVERTTTEYVNGVAQKTTAKFRVYSSYAESFRDYANVLRSNSRYSSVISHGKDAAGFARGLQKAGYATDPAYADKLMRLINGPSLKQAVNSAPPTQAAAKIDVKA
jgi:peptidoglycan hydrolase FlgJ